jgi:hypothetical protein
MAMMEETLVTTVFGGIDCIGWSFDFPLHDSDSGLPSAYACCGCGQRLFHHQVFLTPLYLFTVGGCVPYCSAVPFQTVEWTTFLPHVSTSQWNRWDHI